MKWYLPKEYTRSVRSQQVPGLRNSPSGTKSRCVSSAMRRHPATEALLGSVDHPRELAQCSWLVAAAGWVRWLAKENGASLVGDRLSDRHQVEFEGLRRSEEP